MNKLMSHQNIVSYKPLRNKYAMSGRNDIMQPFFQAVSYDFRNLIYK